MSQKIVIVDTGGANIASVKYALERLGAHGELTQDPQTIQDASHVILPGVGAAKDSMDKLKSANLVSLIQNLKTPTIGICLGMQILFERSTEGPTECLGIIPGEVTRFKGGAGLTIPHMGWNQVQSTPVPTPLFEGIPQNSYFYFVHSYKGAPGPHVTGQAEHGEPFAAMVRKDNFFGTQFHPERSGEQGAQILKNFLKL